jgi:serine/threonine protein kinase/WD40 repeat protein
MSVNNDQSSKAPETAPAIHSKEMLSLLLSSLAEIAEHLGQLHGAGEFHGDIGARTIQTDADGTLTLKHRADAIVVDSQNSNLLFGSSKVDDFGPLTLPSEISKARGILKEHGISLDPVRIDLFQLGEFLCRHVTGESVDSYLSSPRTMAKVPWPLLPVIDGALGIYPDRTFQTSADLALGIEQAIQASEAAQDASLPAPDAQFIQPPSSKPEVSADVDTKTDRPAITHTRDSDLPFTRLGHYEIIRRVGHGGMGDVYVGYEAELERYVAIKVLPTEFSRESDFVQRFRREAASAARLSHPNIVQIFYAGQDAGHLFFAMQLVDGESLAELLARQPVLPIDQCVGLIQQVLAGLAHAHQCGIVHRDIKPGNLLIDHRLRRAMIGDFGLVKSGNADLGLTATGMVMGTAAYISPEQGRGMTVDQRSDLYSLGVVMYQTLSGRLPFTADSPSSLIFQHVYETPTPLSEVSASIPIPLSRIVDRLMAKDPANRYATADEVIADLRRFEANAPMSLPPIGVSDTPRPEAIAAQSSALRRARSVFASSMIPAPKFPDPPSLPKELDLAAGVSRWSKFREQILGAVGKAAPGFYEQLLNTQQQVDGAVAEYERRQAALEHHVRVAVATIEQLQREQNAWLDAEKSAIARSTTTGSETLVTEASEELVRCTRAISDLQREINAQQSDLENTHLRLSQAISALTRIRSQRDLLNARLKIAQARAQLLGGGRRQKPLWWQAGYLSACCCIVAMAAWIVFTVSSPVDFGDDPEVVIENDTATNAPDSKTSGTSPSAMKNFSAEFLLGKEIQLESAPVCLATRPVDSSVNFVQFVVGTRNGNVLTASFSKLNGDYHSNSLEGHRDAVSAVAYSPDCRLLASGDASGEIRIWNLSTSTIHRVLQGHTGEISSLMFNSDATKAMSMSIRDNTIRVWEIINERELKLHSMPQHQFPLTFAYSPGRYRVILAPGLRGADGVGFWGLSRGATFEFSGPEVATVEYDSGRPDGRELQQGRYNYPSFSNSINSWLPSTPQVVQKFGDNIEWTALSRDRSSALTALWNGSLVIWNLTDGKEVGRLVDSTAVRTPRFLSLAISPDDHYAVSGTTDGRMQFWKLPELPMPEGQTQQFNIPERTGVVRVSPDGTAVAAGGEKGIRYWRFDTKQTYSDQVIKTDSPVSSMLFSRDGHSIAFGSGLPRSASSFVSLQSLPMFARPSGSGTPRKCEGHKDSITDVALLKNGSVLLSSSRDGTLKFWSVESGLEASTIDVGVPINSVAVAPDERLALLATDANAIQVVDLATRTVTAKLQGHSFVVNEVNWSPDGSHFISAGGDRTVRVWSTLAMETVQTLEGHEDRVSSAVLSNLGKFAVSGADDATVRLWDVVAEREIKVFRGHHGPVQSVDVDPFFSRAVSVAPDKTIRIWDLTSVKAKHEEESTSRVKSEDSL